MLADATASAMAAPQSNRVSLELAVPPLVHELRNALAALNMALDVADARLRAAGSAGARLQAAAAPVVAHANFLLEDLLELVRPPEVRCRPFDLCRLVTDVAHGPRLRPGAPTALQPQRDVALRLPARAQAFGDEAATAKALGYVLQNAYEALDQGPGRMVLELRACGERDGSWGLHVLDDGPGVPSELHDTLFAPFVSGKRRHLGLGLTHAWRRMHAQGGQLSLTDEAATRFGRGASFCLSLPRRGALLPAD